MDSLAPLLAAQTIENVRDIALIAVLLLLFVFLFVFAILGVLLFRQLRRLASRAESALSRVESGLEKFENAADVVSGFASSVTGIFGGSGLRSLSRMISRWFGGEGEPKDGEAPAEGSVDASTEGERRRDERPPKG